MNKEQKLESIRQACIKANPEIVELKFGCEIEAYGEVVKYVAGFNTSNGRYYEFEPVLKDGNSIYSKDAKVIGRPIRLADVLLAIKESKEWGKVLPRSRQSDEELEPILKHRSEILGKLVQSYWNLRADDLTQQSPECIDFLFSLLPSPDNQ